MTEPQIKPCEHPDTKCTCRKGYLCTGQHVAACGPATVPGLQPPTGEVEDLETDEAREYERATPSRKTNPMNARQHINRRTITEEVVTSASRTFISTIQALNRNIREEPAPARAGEG